MRRANLLVVLVIMAIATAGCFRTAYVNLHPPMPSPEVAQANPPSQPPSRWQHFFLFGWIPSERLIRADEICGGSERVKEIRTRQTFLEGLVEALSSYYVNIYSPWDAEVVCKTTPAESTAAK